jgi:hypothetical protein
MSDISTNLFSIQAEKYIVGRLASLSTLTDIKTFICGAVTEAEVPMDLTPYCEIFIESEDEQKGMLARDESSYTGKLRFVVNLAQLPGSDFVQEAAGRVVVLDSHAQTAYYVTHCRDELRRCVNSDFADLTVDTEYVCEFKLRQVRYGLGFDQRRSSWYNVGEIDFFIRTQRTTEA